MKKYIVFFILFGLYILVFFGTSYRLYNRLGVFGCGDECINYTAAHFLKMGKPLYSQVFFNRQPLMAYASLAVQWVTHPESLYALVLYHRLAFVLYAFVMGLFLIWRFRVPALLFLVLYEGTKFYVYGYQFIGEAVIVYPLVYATAVVWQTFQRKNIWTLDWYLVPFCIALVFWTREPYIPVAVGILAAFVFAKRKDIRVYRSVFLSVLFFITPYLTIPIGEYIRQVIEINARVASVALDPKSLLYAFGYPIAILFSGKQTFFREIEIGIMVFVGIALCLQTKAAKNYVSYLVMFGILGLAAIRSVAPGVMYFEAFHMLPWYGLACMMCVLFIDSIVHHRAKIFVPVGFILFALWAFTAPNAFIWEKVDKQAEFESQYAKYSHYSLAIKLLAQPTQKIFLDMWDDVIYWESARDSSYPYSLYIPVAAGVSPYKEARISMFRKTPPDMYYSCPQLQSAYNSLPSDIAPNYTQLLSQGAPSCLYVHNALVVELSTAKREALSQLGFTTPKVR